MLELVLELKPEMLMLELLGLALDLESEPELLMLELALELEPELVLVRDFPKPP